MDSQQPEPRRQVVVRVDREGTVSAETFGMVGAECLDYVSVLEDVLDATTVHSSTTADYDRGVAETAATLGQERARQQSQTDGVD